MMTFAEMARLKSMDPTSKTEPMRAMKKKRFWQEEKARSRYSTRWTDDSRTLKKMNASKIWKVMNKLKHSMATNDSRIWKAMNASRIWKATNDSRILRILTNDAKTLKETKDRVPRMFWEATSLNLPRKSMAAENSFYDRCQ